MIRRLHSGATPLLIAVIVFLAAAVGAAAVVWKLESHRLEEKRERAASLAGDHAEVLQSNLERTLSATYALAAMVRQGHGEFPAFEEVARQMLRYFPGADSLQLAPGGVTRHIVPLAGNEAGLGRDLLRDPLRNKEALLARDSKQLTLAGPFELIQGGIGVVGRFPVFLEDAGDERFWGFATVVIRFPKILEQIGLTQLSVRGFAYQLWRVHPDTGERQLIAASVETPLAGAIEHPVRVPNGTWTLSLAPLAGWGAPVGLSLKIALGLFSSLLLAWIAKLVIESKMHEAELEKLVAERTAEIRESEQRLRQIEDNLPESYVYQDVHTADGTTRFLYISAGVERMHGVTVEDVLHDAGTLHRQIDPEQMPALMAAEAASLREMRDFAIELRMRRVDGEWRWMQVRSRPRHRGDGQVVWDGVATDITERRQAEEALRLERDFSAAVLDSLPEILYLFDDQLRYLRWNRNTEQVLGYSSEEIARMSALDFFAGDDLQRVSERIQKVFEQGKAEVEADLVTKSGARLPYYLTGNRMLVNGRPCVLGVGVNIADRRRAEEDANAARARAEAALTALSESEARLKLFIEHAPAALAMLDLEMRYLAVSRRWLADYGLTGEELLGRCHYDVFPEIGEDWKTAHRSALAGKVVRSAEDRFQRTNGSALWLRWEIHPWHAADGRVGGIVIFSEDITERHRAEQERLELIGQLEKRNAELERFTYTVSHDLKSPLVTILGFTGQLEQDLRDQESESIAADLAFIRGAAGQMSELLDSLLKLSRAGRSLGELQSVDLIALAQNVIEQLGGRLSHASLEFDTPSDLPVLMGDPLRLCEVFQNLLENAAKFTIGDANPHIEIGCRHGDGEVVCYVRDNGIGIPPEYQEKIFDLFEQLDPRKEGTGIGLAIVRRIVEEHGGRVWVESAGSGHGSTFYFTLPA